MLINSIKFVVFASLVVFLYYVFPIKKRWIVLLVSSYIFYYLSSKNLIIFILLSTLSIYLAGIYIDKVNNKKEELTKEKIKSRKKIIMLSTVLFNTLILLVLKYSNFFIGSFNGIFRKNIPFVKILLPLGISYYTLQAISYVVDVYRGKYKPSKNIFEVALYLSFFPIITEGPISRFDFLAPKIYNGNKLKYENIINGLSLMLWGFFKKLVIADRAAIYVNEVFGNNLVGGGTVVVAIILYTIQIYAEFSGCMDIVTGLSKTMGIELASNFERPFFSRSIQEFWRRWHKTLGAWLKDYIFYPISLSHITMKITKNARKKLNKNLAKFVPVAFSLFFVWFLNGFWHGASWKYILYGLYYYIIMMIGLLFKPLTDKMIEKLKIDTNSFGYRLFQIIRTCILVFIGMMLFRSKTIGDAFNMFVAIFTKPSYLLTSFGLTAIDFIIILISCLMLLIYGVLEEHNIKVIEELNNNKLWVRYLIYLTIIFMIIIFGIYGPGYNPSDFIYGQF